MVLHMFRAFFLIQLPVPPDLYSKHPKIKTTKQTNNENTVPSVSIIETPKTNKQTNKQTKPPKSKEILHWESLVSFLDIL